MSRFLANATTLPARWLPARGRWRGQVGRWLGQGADLLFPPQCALCGQECVSPILLCGSCRPQLIDPAPACARCAARLPAGWDQSRPCPQCRMLAVKFQAAVRLGHYDGALREAVLRSKHMSGEPLAETLGRLLLAERQEQLAQLGLDVVVPLPMHWTRRMWRGTNNPDILARRLAAGLALPFAPRLLRRSRRTRTQTGLTRPARQQNVRGSFSARPNPNLSGARVLIVDDVMTTCATASEAAAELFRAGVEFVAVAVLARAEGPH